MTKSTPGHEPKTGLDLLPETVGVVLDVDRCGVVHDPVQDGRGDDRVAKDFVPLGEASERWPESSEYAREVEYLVLADRTEGIDVFAVDIARNPFGRR